MIIASPRILLPDGSLRPGRVRTEGPRIAQVALDGASDSAQESADLTVPILAPGLVDMHCHGGGGASFATTDPDEARAAVDLHHRHGSTSVVASLVTAPVDVLEQQLATLAPLVREGSGVLAGLHLEGPWLSPQRPGAHDPSLLRHPDAADVDRLVAAADGQLRMVTLAPELPGATEAITRLVDAGVVVAVGHTDCDADGLRAAVAAGATVVTHLLNAMRPIHHREPGPVTAALAEQSLTLELIVDGIHVHPEVVDLLHRATRAKIALITDAMAAAGCGDGSYTLGSLQVEVRDGAARLAGGGSIAGSTLTLDRAVRGAVATGVPLGAALRSATSVPARALGIDAGSVQVGAPADLVALDDDLVPVQVWRGGDTLG